MHVCRGVRDIYYRMVDEEVEWVVTANHILCDFLLHTVPPPIPHCSTTAVYNGSSDELTNIVVGWTKAEVSLECLILNNGIPMCILEYCGASLCKHQ